jgi:ankyrin repeat protein
MPILLSQMNPSEPFIADDYLSPYDRYDQPARNELPDPILHRAERVALEDARRRRRRERLPQVAFRRLVLRRDTADLEEESDDVGDGTAGRHDPTHKVDLISTTPLHEAARLGAGDLVQFLLANGGDPNVKNGLARTALHTCAGGRTAEEDRLFEATGVSKKQTKKRMITGAESSVAEDDSLIGIRAPVIPDDVLELMRDPSPSTENDQRSNGGTNNNGGTLRMMGRFLVFRKAREEVNGDDEKVGMCDIKPDPDRLDAIVTERMDVALALLSWVNSDTCEGPSINAVDADGRTALHYAAELGRADVCMAILSNFGVMLTIVDDLGARTPCELAALRGHDHLAAQLEARALLYVDPFGLDDDLMDNMMEASSGDPDNPRARLVAPYKWFETTNLDGASEERTNRLMIARSKLMKAAAKYGGQAEVASSIPADVEKANLDVEKPDSESDDDCAQSALEVDNVIPSQSDTDDDGEKQAVRQSPTLEAGEWVGLQHRAGFHHFSRANPHAFGEKVTKTSRGDVAKAGGNEASSNGFRDLERMVNLVHDRDVERFMTLHKWDVTEAMRVFRSDPVEAFVSAGISLPDGRNKTSTLKTDSRFCQICYDADVDKSDWMQLRACGHAFCKDCLGDYVRNCANSKIPLHATSCPHHECDHGFSYRDMEDLLAGDLDVLKRITDASTEHFITSSSDYRFCTHPGCGGVVRRLPQPAFTRAGFGAQFLDYTGATCVAIDSQCEIGEAQTLTYEGVEDGNYSNCQSKVQPRKAHRFCFACGESVHWPLSCEKLDEWKDKMREEIGDVEGESTGADFNDLAQKMWLKANTRPCPMCNVPIEKNEGCNHMTCTNPSCLHEFCWICRKDWKLHGTSTGGFFRCNIWQEEDSESGRPNGVAPIPTHSDTAGLGEPDDQGYGTAIFSAREAWKKSQEMNRFLHHYSRYEAHGESSALERQMGDSVCTRLAPVVEAAVDFDGSPSFNFRGQGLSFVHAAFTELLECRSVLRHSYPFSYFRYLGSSSMSHRLPHLHRRRKEKLLFERLQSELETLTEQMSDIVARSHLRATQVQISFLTAGAAEKRLELSNLIFEIFREEKKEAAKIKHRHEADETSSPRPDAGRSGNQVPRIRNVNTLSELLTMHQRMTADNQFVGQDLNRALEGFLVRALDVEQQPPRRQEGARGDGVDGVQMWQCEQCTFMNSGGRSCAMCEGPR